MSTSRFTVTSLLLLAIIISVIGFLFTVLLPELSDHSAVNDYFPIEGTNLGVRYSSPTGSTPARRAPSGWRGTSATTGARQRRAMIST